MADVNNPSDVGGGSPVGTPASPTPSGGVPISQLGSEPPLGSAPAAAVVAAPAAGSLTGPQAGTEASSTGIAAPPERPKFPLRTLIAGLGGLVLVAGLSTWFFFIRGRDLSGVSTPSAQETFPVTDIASTAELAEAAVLGAITNQDLSINGLLKINKGLILTPGTQPASPQDGQLYLDQATGTIFAYHNGEFKAQVSSTTVTNVTQQSIGVGSINGQSGAVNLNAGPGIAISGTTITNAGARSIIAGPGASVSNDGSGNYTISTTVSGPYVQSVGGVDGVISLGPGLTTSGQQLQNTGVLDIAGLGGSIGLGVGLQVSGTNIINSGVTNLSTNGTLTASSATGAVVLSLPQSIATSATPTFVGINLSSPLPLGSGGTGLNISGAIADKILIGSGTALSLKTLVGTGSIVIDNTSPSQVSISSTFSCTPLCANTRLDNLDSNVTILGTTQLKPGNDKLIDLGASTNAFKDLYLGDATGANITPTTALTVGASAQNLTLQGAATSLSGTSVSLSETTGTFTTTLTFADATANRAITIPDAAGTVAVSASGNIALSAAGNVTFTGTLPIANGGTGLGTAPTNGQLLIGNAGNYNLAGLTQGSGITITTGPGSITIAADGSGCTTITCATRELNNLQNVAINVDLKPGTAAGASLGTLALPFKELFLAGTSVTPGSGQNFKFTGAATAARTYTLQDLSGTIGLVQTAGGSVAQNGDLNVGTGTLIATVHQGGTFKTADATGGTSGSVSIKSGDTGTGGTSGNLTIDAGTGTVARGTITLGGTNASDLILGRVGLTVKAPGGLDTQGGNLALGAGNFTNTGTINSQTISSAANLTGTLTVQGASALTLGTASANTGSILFKNSGGINDVTLKASNTNPTASYTLTLPVNVGNNGDCLKQTDASGQLGFVACAAGLGGSGTSNTVAKWTGAGSLGDSSLTDDGTNISIQGTAKIFTVEGKIRLGLNGVSGARGDLVFRDGTNPGREVTVQAQQSGSTYTLQLPDTDAIGSSCLILQNVAAGVNKITGGSCAAGGSGGNVTASGATTNRLARFTNSGPSYAVAASLIQDDSAGIGINTAPAAGYILRVGSSNAFNVTDAGQLEIGGASPLTLAASGAITNINGLTFKSGTAIFDQSASTGTFATGTGNVSLKGNVAVDADKTFLVNGLTLNTQATGTVGSATLNLTVNKNDALTKTFQGLHIQPTINAGASNTNTTLNVLNVDTTNTATTGVTTNLLRLAYGGTERLKVTSAGDLTISNFAASGVVVNNATGVLSSLSALDPVRGGTGLTSVPTVNGQLVIGKSDGSYTIGRLVSTDSSVTITAFPGGNPNDINLQVSSCASCANTALSNLDGVAIANGDDLLPANTGMVNLGSATKAFGNLFLGDSDTNIQLTPAAGSGTVSITVPNLAGTVVLAQATPTSQAGSILIDGQLGAKTVSLTGSGAQLSLSDTSTGSLTLLSATNNQNTFTGNLLDLQSTISSTTASRFKVEKDGKTTIGGNLLVGTIEPTGALLTVGSGAQSLTLTAKDTASDADGISDLKINIGTNGTDSQFVFPGDQGNNAGSPWVVCTTFGNCAGTGGGVTSSTNTTGRVARFTGANQIGNSLIQDNGTGIGIGPSGNQAPAGNTMLTLQGAGNDNTAIALNVTSNGGTSLLSVRNDGRVGIGISGVGAAGPEQKLDVNGNLQVRRQNDATAGTQTVDSYTMNFQGSYWDGAAAQSVSMKLFNDVTAANAYTLRFQDNAGANIMSLTNGGNLAIGNFDPTTRLDIDGGITFRAASVANAPANQGRIWFDTTTNKFKVSENNGGPVDLVASGASFVNGGNNFGATVASLGNIDVGGELAFKTNGNTERARFDTNGNFLLGVSTGSQRLKVQGDSLFTYTAPASAGTYTANSILATNSCAGCSATIKGLGIDLTGTATTGTNTNIGLDFGNVNALSNNTFTAINVGTGYNNIINSASFKVAANGVTQLQAAPPASSTQSLLALGQAAITGGSANGTFIGLNTSVATSADLVHLQNNGVTEFKVTSAGVGTFAGGLNVTAGGATITAGGLTVSAGGINVNSTGITNAGPISGATTIAQNDTLTNSKTGGVAVSLTGAPAASTTSSLIQIGTAINGGSGSGTYIGINPASFSGNFMDLQVNGTTEFRVAASGATTITDTLSVSGTASFTATGSNAVAVTGTPSASATASLVQIGSAIAGGSANGTYLGMNAASGFTGNLMDLQLNGAARFSVNNAGNTSIAGTLAVTGAATLTAGISANGGTIVSTTGKLVFSGGARNSQQITMKPEFVGAVLGVDDGTNNIGTMVSGNDGGTNAWRNFYEWTSAQSATLHDYTLFVRVALPADFDAWESGACPGSNCALEIAYQTGVAGTTNNAVSFRVNNESESPTTAICTVADASSTTWTSFGCASSTLDDGTAPEWDAAGETAIIRIKMKANNTASAKAKVGDLTLRYLSKF